MAFKSVKGTRDILPGDSERWQFVEHSIRQAMHRFNYHEIRTPVFEETALFARGIGEDTDIVGKEMYTFLDKGKTSLTLRPEMTAPVVRSYLQHNLQHQSPLQKLYYIAPMFRQERPQAGRLRQFHQFGMEAIGLDSPRLDAEVIALAVQIYTALDISFSLKINSVGDPGCRPAYRKELQAFLVSAFDDLSADSQRRMETNPLRVLDSKDPGDREVTKAAPSILDFLCEPCRTHFNDVLQLLDDIGVEYTVDPRLVRGLDYYTKTAFEFISADLGAQDALGGGGRYDNLAEQLGGKPTPAVGFAAGIERLLIVMEQNGFEFPESGIDVFLVALDDKSRQWAFRELYSLRSAGLAVDIDYAGRSIKAQMREANRQRARFVVIIGEEELATETASVKNMQVGEQHKVNFDDLQRFLVDNIPLAP